MHDTLNTLLTSYGYAFLFLIVAVESFGVPLPGETTLVTAAAIAATGKLEIAGVIASAALGAIVGDNLGYWAGRKGGLPFVHRYGRYVRLDESKINRVHGFFERHGPKTVFIGRFIALLRSWAAVLAGVAEMPFGVFLAFNASGGITWALLFGLLGYGFGHNLALLHKYLAQASLAFVLLVTLAVALGLGIRWLRGNWTAIGETLRTGHTGRLFGVLRARFPRTWAFGVARFSREEYLGLHLTVGLLVSLAALWLFAGITEDVIHHDPLTRLDLAFADWLHSQTTPLGNAIFNAISLIGSPVVVGTIGLSVMVILFLKRQRTMLLGWIAAFAGTGFLNWALKHAIQRPRPSYSLEYLHGESFSFPSGHAMGSLVAYVMLAYVLNTLWVKDRGTQILIIVLTVFLVLAIGVSRLYLGVHYFSDVVGGYAAGLVWLAACISGVEIARRRAALVEAAGLDVTSPASMRI